MTLTEKQKAELEEFIERINSYKARHTELITVLVPKGFEINLITRQLESEKSTAANIKSTGTRKNVQEALESLVRITKSMKQTPKNGIALFAGNVSRIEGQNDFIAEAFEPPEELNVRLYRCDQTFVIKPLEEMLEVKEVYGLIAIERNEATIGLLIGKKIKVLHKFESYIPGKTNKGGQCLSPNTLIIINDKKKALKDINLKDKILSYNFKDNKPEESECINKWYIKKDKLIHIVFSNNIGITASEDHLFFVKNNRKIIEKPAVELTKNDKLINQNGEGVIIKKIYKENLKEDPMIVEEELIDIETKNHNFIANGLIVHNSAARYARVRETMAKEFFRKIAEVAKKEFFNLKELKGILIGGPGPTKEDFLKEGNLITSLKEKILAIKDIGYADEHGLELLVETSQDALKNQEIIHEKMILEKFFDMLGKQKLTAYRKIDVEKALNFGAVDILLLSKKLPKSELIDLQKKAEKTSTKIELISIDTEEGVQFWNISGTGAILRFNV